MPAVLGFSCVHNTTPIFVFLRCSFPSSFLLLGFLGFQGTEGGPRDACMRDVSETRGGGDGHRCSLWSSTIS